MDYWYYFLHRAIELTNKNGTISFITPRYWLNGAGATKLIERIKEELSFRIMVDIGKLKVFDNVVGYHMIAEYSKIKNDNFAYRKLENNLSDINKLSDTENLSINILKNSEVITEGNEILLEKDEQYDNCVLLGDIADVSQGVVEASDRISNRMYSKNPREDMFVGKGIFVLNKDELDSLNLNDYEMELIVPYIDGNDLSRYHISDARNWLIYSDKDAKEKIQEDANYIHLKNHLDYMGEYITSSNAPYGIHRPRKRKYFDNPKIIMPSMFGDNNFAIDYDNHYFVGMSFSCILAIDKDYPLEYLLAVLNSSTAKEWFYKFGKRRGVGVDIGVDKVRSFPIKKCDESTRNNIIEKVKILSTDYENNIELDKELDEIIKNLYEEK